jgi:hypothetical protein
MDDEDNYNPLKLRVMDKNDKFIYLDLADKNILLHETVKNAGAVWVKKYAKYYGQYIQ